MIAVSLLKTTLAPALIGIASWVARRWGPSAGGWFAALPLSSGPVVLVLTLQRGHAFGAEACIGTLLALTSLSAYALVYSWSAQWLSWVWSTISACAAYLSCTFLLHTFLTPLLASFLVVCAILAITVRLMPFGVRSPRPAPPPAWDIPVRMAAAVALIWILTSAAGALGARTSGLLTPFPIAVSIMAGAVHHFEGTSAARLLLRSMVAGLFSFAVFFLVVGAMIATWSVASAFLAATLGAMFVHAGVWRWLRWSST